MENVEVATVEGHGFLDGLLVVEREPDGDYHVQMNAGVGTASIRVRRAQLSELYLALGRELGNVEVAVVDIERSLGGAS